MKGCELCPGAARMYCESDQARLCFECDAKVHGANFLVARHSRVLLCRSCQAPTPWKAAGPRLGPTVSVCDRCVAAAGRSARKEADDREEDEGDSGDRRERVGEEEDNGDDVDDEDEATEDRESEEEDEEEEEEGEEQVVPWTAEPPPVASSSSSEEESVERIGGGLLKRMRACSQDQLPCSSSSRLSYLPNRTGVLSPVRTAADDEATSDSFRPLKDRKKLDFIRAGSHGFSAISFGSARPPI